MERSCMRRYENYVKALEVLSRAPQQDLENEFIQSGIIDKFSMQFELAWKLMKALLAYEGDCIAQTGSPREIIKAAYRYFPWMSEDLWLQMLRDRNNMAHVYDAEAAGRLVTTILDSYLPEFSLLEDELVGRYGEDFLLS